MVDKVLRVLTANLYNGGAAIGSLRRLLRQEHPDVAAFQEMDPAAARIIEQHFPHGHLDPRRDHHGMGIAAAHPIDVERLSMTHRDGWRGLVANTHWPHLDRTLEVINLHIQNPLMRPLRQTARNRKGQVDDLLAYLSTKRMPRVVLGDMNSSPVWRTYKRLATAMHDAATAAGTEQRTWSQPHWMPRLLRIDHAFVEGLVPLSTHTARIKGSDHSALIVDLYVE